MQRCTAWRDTARLSSYATYVALVLLLLALPSARGISASSAWNAAAHPLSTLEVVRQSQPTSCGPAALATLLSWLGRPHSEKYLLGLTELGADGLSLAEFARLAHVMDVPGAWFRSPPARLAQLPTPFVAHLELPGAAAAGHLVVVRNVTRGYVVVADPALGAHVMPLQRFVRDFSGRVYLLEGRS